MVCDDCERKLSKVIVPDKWKNGARNTNDNGGRSTKYKNSLLQVRGAEQRFLPSSQKCCRICKKQVAQDAAYCQVCAFENGICAMCGKTVNDLRFDRRVVKKRVSETQLPPAKRGGDYGTSERFQTQDKAEREVLAASQKDENKGRNQATADALEVAANAIQRNANRILTDPIQRPKVQGATHDYSGWASAKDPSTGKIYYYNTLTKQTSWRWPPSLGAHATKDQKQQQQHTDPPANTSDFISSTIFTGRRSGFIFSTRSQGTGYYRDLSVAAAANVGS